MFEFVTKYLGFLKRIPLLPHIFDAGLDLFYTFFRKEISASMEHIKNSVADWPGITLSMHKYGGIQFNYGKKEIGHMHSNGIVDVLLDRKTKEELMAKNLVEDHHVFKKSGWVSVYVKSKEQAESAISVLEIALLRCKFKMV